MEILAFVVTVTGSASESVARVAGDSEIESAVSRLSLELSVSSVSWNVIEQVGVVIAGED